MNRFYNKIIFLFGFIIGIFIRKYLFDLDLSINSKRIILAFIITFSIISLILIKIKNYNERKNIEMIGKYIDEEFNKRK